VARKYIEALHAFFKDHPYDFEACAVELARFFLPDLHTVQITRPWRDGGRDATGLLSIGRGAGTIDIDFALEAKLYDLKNAVGVREVSRLISRLRYRQFGILVTTSYLHKQAYEEIVTDGHPIVVLCASDIGRVLSEKFTTLADLRMWLESVKANHRETS
jgi:Restriction endonuclease